MWSCTFVDLVTPPLAEPATLDEFINYAHASASDGVRLSLILSGCRADIERRLGRSLVTQTIRGTYQFLVPEMSLIMGARDLEIELIQGPVQVVSLIEVMTGPNVWETLDSGMYVVSGRNVVLQDTTLFYTSFYNVNQYYSLRVTYTVGPTNIDPADKLMLLQYAAHRYLLAEDDTIPEAVSGAIFRSKDWSL